MLAMIECFDRMILGMNDHCSISAAGDTGIRCPYLSVDKILFSTEKDGTQNDPNFRNQHSNNACAHLGGLTECPIIFLLVSSKPS